MVKKLFFFASVIVALVILLASCGHEHEWLEATCVNPKTCKVCGKTEGDTTAHFFTKATCTEKSTCVGCGKIKAMSLGGMGHYFTEATCKTPKTCISCGKTEGGLAAHTFGDWQIIKNPSYTEEGTQARYCSCCGKSDFITIAKKSPQVIALTTDNFANYFNVTNEYVYDEYFGGTVMHYGTIDVTFLCAQSVPGDLENVTITLALYPRGGIWDVIDYTNEERLVNIIIPVKTGVGTGTKHMGFGTTKPLSSKDCRKPDTIDIVIVEVTGTITIYP